MATASSKLSYTQTHTHTHIQTHRHIYVIHTGHYVVKTNTYTRTHTNTHTHTLTHAHTHTHTHTQIHAGEWPQRRQNSRFSFVLRQRSPTAKRSFGAKRRFGFSVLSVLALAFLLLGLDLGA